MTDRHTTGSRSRRVGAAAMLVSGLGFGMSGVFTRSIEGGAWEIASWRGLTATPLIVAYVWWRRVILTVGGSLGAGNLEGDLLAVALSLTLASLIVLIRRFPGTDALPAQAGSGVALFAVALVVADPFGMEASEMPLSVAFGLVFAVALILWTEGVRRLRAAEAALLATTETDLPGVGNQVVVRRLEERVDRDGFVVRPVRPSAYFAKARNDRRVGWEEQLRPLSSQTASSSSPA